MSEFKLDFRDTATAFADKSDAQLKEKYRLFKMMSSPVLSSLSRRAARFALSIGLPIDPLIKRTVFKQFLGGETIEECQGTINELAAVNIGTILDYAVEGKTTDVDFDLTKDQVLKNIQRAKDDPAIPFAVFKVTGVAPLGTLERMSAKKKLDAKSQAKCERTHNRINEICEFAHSVGQPVFIDAEETWIQDAIDNLATEMMEKYNRDDPIVFNTLQMYRTDRLQHLKDARRRAAAGRYFYGVKLVRGAYMEKERERALEMGYPSPIHPDKASTDRDYDAAIEYCLKHHEDVAFVAATHNEQSTQLLAQKMHAMKVPENSPGIHFSQLYGMSDNLSYVLAKNNYNVTKYVPYGPVKDALPYLIRRAEENTSTAGHVNRELELIRIELERRRAAGRRA